MAKMKCETCGRLVVDGPADQNYLLDGPMQSFDAHLRGCPAPSLAIILPDVRRKAPK